MDTSDDPTHNKQGFFDLMTGETEKREKLRIGPTATGPDPLSRDILRRDSKRKRQAAASFLTRDWLPPTLGIPGLLGAGQ